jgi:hypothetical protein
MNLLLVSSISVSVVKNNEKKFKLKIGKNAIWVELSSINDWKRIYVLFYDEWCWKMGETKAGSSRSINTFFFWVLEVLILSNCGLELAIYDCFLLLEVVRSLFDEEIEVWRCFKGFWILRKNGKMELLGQMLAAPFLRFLANLGLWISCFYL